ncbi:MAG: histidine triad nucleotide-binding protein [Leptospiraceae bacterium]|nr:histidine triad nucleotide-binding protein [Leptospiraceae bacterium]MCP5501189.1 histidine triad nucleotide-binding protein [Leptospiraceae bacterium]
MEETIFSKIIRKEIPAKIVYEDEDILAFEDINPVAPTHVLFIPKKVISSLDALTEENVGLIGKLLLTISRFASEKGLEKEGYRVVTNTGKNAGQTVFHIHFHLLAGRQMNWPPG